MINIFVTLALERLKIIVAVNMLHSICLQCSHYGRAAFNPNQPTNHRSRILFLQKQGRAPADREVKLEAEGAVAEEVTPLTLTFQTSSLCAQTCLRQLVRVLERRRALLPANTEQSPPRFPLLKEEPLPQANWPRAPSDSRWP